MGFLDEVASSFDPFEYGEWSRIELISRLISERKELKSRLISERKELKSRMESSNGVLERAPIVDDDDDDEEEEEEEEEEDYDEDEDVDEDEDEDEDEFDDNNDDDDEDDDDYDYDDEYDKFKPAHPPLTVDDCVIDYPPMPDHGCRRTYRISSTGRRINLGAPFGHTYIFVQGKDSACIVTRRGLNPEQEEPEFYCDMKTILMCLADRRLKSLNIPMSEKHGDLKQSAVVSVRMSPNEISQDMESNKVSPSIGMKEVINLLKDPTRASLHEQSAVSMLQSKLENDARFTFAETIETAISAMQCLCQVVFRDDEIEVYVAGEEGRMKRLLTREEIGGHLAAINNRVST